MNSVNPQDRLLGPISMTDREAVRTQIANLAMRDGEVRANRDGWTVTYQPDGLTLVTCRHIIVPGRGYRMGAYVNHSEVLRTKSGGRYVEKTDYYDIPKWDKPYFTGPVVSEYDADGVIVDVDKEIPPGLSPDDWAVLLERRNRWLRKYDEVLYESPLNKLHLQKLIKILGGLSSDDVVEGVDSMLYQEGDAELE